MIDIICHNISKPINIGGAIRLAYGTNSKLYFTGNSVSHTNRKAKLAAVGYEDRVDLTYRQDIEELIAELRGAGKLVLGTSPYSDILYTKVDYSAPVAFIFGGEAHGLSKHILSMTDYNLYIPISNNIDSLNLVSSMSILVYEALRHRDFEGLKKWRR